MWKFVARGIRETFERRACRTNVYSQSSQESNTNPEVKNTLTCDQKIRSPATVAYKGFCGSAKNSGTEDKQDESKWHTKYNWSEAVGWSSILAVGWVVCQTLCLRKTISESEKRCSFTYGISQLSEARLKYLIGQVLNLERKHVLPITYCAGKTGNKYTQAEREQEWIPDKPFGPMTVEEALIEAATEFAKTHNTVIGEYEHFYGMRALEEKRYKDAIKHFTAGAKLLSPASMFNLGLCHELGLGTIADEAKAVKYYADAAKHGHADAIYNLGVFHAQGRGGFSIDINRARNYFVQAAKLGQTQAQHALRLEKDIYNSSHTQNAPEKTYDTSIDYRVRVNARNILSKLVGYSMNLALETEDETSNYDRTSYETKTPTEIFLDFLGLTEQSSVSVSMVPNNCNVPC